jgi:non-specific serine/threonine protein kinase
MSSLTPVAYAPRSGAIRPFTLAPLPVPATSLVGRRQEVRDAQDMLRRPDVRLVTLVGPSGVGKSRVALSAAASLDEEFPDGIAVPLTPWLRDPDSLELAIARSLGVREAGEQSLTDALIEALRARTTLLVVGHMGRLRSAAPLLTTLLTACPRLKILTTSQAPLDLPGEQVISVAPLASPPNDTSSWGDARAYPAVRLFQERVGGAWQDTVLNDEYAATVARLCQRLAGLPLAIELAAARVPELSPATLLSQLGERLPQPGRLPAAAYLDAARASTLRWSYDRLSLPDQANLRRLSIFAGPFTQDAATHVGSADITHLLAAGLVRRAPVDAESPSYFMLESVRAFARQLLDEAGEDGEVQHRHATYFAGLATSTSETRNMPGDRARLDQLAANYPDLRQALAWLQDHDAHEALYLAGSLFDLWHTTGMYSEGRAWLQRTLANDHDAPPEIRLSALGAAAALALLQGDLHEATNLVHQELPLARHLGDPYGLLVALINAGLLAYSESEFATSKAYFREAHQLAFTLEVEDPQVRSITGTVLGNLGSIAMAEGDVAGATASLTASVETLRQVNYPWASLGPLVNLGALHLWQGDAVQAAALLSEAIDAASTTRDPRQTASLLLALACLFIERGRPTLGAQILGTADRLATALHVPFDPAERLLRERASESASGSLGERAFTAALTVGRDIAADAMLARAQASLVPQQRTSGPPPISPREAEVLHLASQGLTDRGIAETLFISQRTVSNHVARALAKLGVRTRQEATELAQQMGWLTVATQDTET